MLSAGNRIINKDCLEQSISSHNLKSYHLEIAQNEYLLNQHKKVGYLEVDARDVTKVSKVGWIQGLYEEMHMWFQIISYKGLWYFIQLSINFPLKKVV